MCVWLGICAVDDSVPKIQEREREENIIKSKNCRVRETVPREQKKRGVGTSVLQSKTKKKKDNNQSDTLPFRTNGQLHRHGAGGGGGGGGGVISVQVSLSESLQTRARA